jgi:hypothetical protein
MADAEYQPLTGDPDLIESKAAHYAQIAEAIDRSVRFLNAVRDMEGMTSKAVSAVSGKAGDVSDDIAKAFDRYSHTASALTGYSGLLREAQDDANAALTDIEHKQNAADAAHRAAATAQQTAQDASDDDKDDAQNAATKAATAASDATAALQAAQAAWHAAWTKKHDAGNTAKGKIAEVVTGSKNHGLKDPGGFWHALGELAKAAFKVFKTICDIAGILSVFLAWVPILGEVLMVLAAVGAIIDLVTTIVNGGSFLDILLASVNVVLTVFGGKLIGELAKGLKTASVAKVGEKMLVKGEDATSIAGELNRLQGITGRHAKNFANFTTRRGALRYINQQRKSIDSFGKMSKNAFGKSFKPNFGGKTKLETGWDMVKANWTPYGLGGKDVYGMLKVAGSQTVGLDGKLTAQILGVTGLQVGKDAFDIHKVESKEGWGHGVPELGKGWSKIGDAPGKAVDFWNSEVSGYKATWNVGKAGVTDIAANVPH